MEDFKKEALIKWDYLDVISVAETESIMLTDADIEDVLELIEDRFVNIDLDIIKEFVLDIERERDFNIIVWPESQNYIGTEGAELLNTESELERFGPSAYRIPKDVESKG